MCDNSHYSGRNKNAELELKKETLHILSYYQDAPRYRKAVLFALAEVARKYDLQATYAYKGLSSIDEERLDKERIDLRIFSYGLLHWLSKEQDCSQSCQNAQQLLRTFGAE